MYNVYEKNYQKTIQNTIKATNQAINDKVTILNISMGGHGFNQEELDAYKKATNKGIKIVISAGNNGYNLSFENCIEFLLVTKRKYQSCCGL